MRRPQLSGDRVQSRWWYWIAAVPIVFVFWLVTVAWVAFAMSIDPSFVGDSAPSFFVRLLVAIPHATVVSLVAVGIPFAVLIAILPLAVFQDTVAINRAETGWEPSSRNFALSGLLGLIAAVVVGIFTIDISLAIIAGFVLSVPFALYYLRERHEKLGVP
ncbi:hypothetical protein [Haladaptatus caseinilyticus]|uniref:hypothetical protein n=1 Tax=Haladaptatus caseinilyticus TaxID=2993314 RepID=UPI00224B7530|nr:hypothetical protein [Haladaptatus caseinilyticus]